jgi:CubicO group peptidase (beta-lactamase class C family)
MITGVHAIVFNDDAEGTRAFFRDALGFQSVDAGGGWLIFALPFFSLAFGLVDEEGQFSVARRRRAHTYYGVDLRDVALNRTQIEGLSGLAFQYNNYNPLLLGLVLERATGTSVSDFSATRLWQPLGADADATWNLDSERSGFEKMESGLNARAVDYARFGLLFLHNGEWNGRRIVSEEWVRAATRADPVGRPRFLPPARGYFWWIDVNRPASFYAMGKYGQYIYLAPDADAVVVRVGRDSGVGNSAWLMTFRNVADQFERRP